MARFSSLAHPDTDGERVKNTLSSVFWANFFATRFKELNTYSGRLTRCIATVFGRICFDRICATRRHGSAAERRSVRFASNLDVVDGCIRR
jgi:hypothetical protein